MAENKRVINENTRSDDILVAKLAVAFTFLSMAPYDNWGHIGDPAEMAAYVVQDCRKQGRLGFMQDAMGVLRHMNPS